MLLNSSSPADYPRTTSRGCRRNCLYADRLAPKSPFVNSAPCWGRQCCASTRSVNITVGCPSTLREMELKSACRMFLFPVQMFYHIIRASLFSLLPSRRKDLSKEVVLITGGGRGIGRHLAKEFAQQGARKVNSTTFCAHFIASTLLQQIYKAVLAMHAFT